MLTTYRNISMILAWQQKHPLKVKDQTTINAKPHNRHLIKVDAARGTSRMQGHPYFQKRLAWRLFHNDSKYQQKLFSIPTNGKGELATLAPSKYLILHMLYLHQSCKAWQTLDP